jgi:hypothetical protein
MILVVVVVVVVTVIVDNDFLIVIAVVQAPFSSSPVDVPKVRVELTALQYRERKLFIRMYTVDGDSRGRDTTFRDAVSYLNSIVFSTN